MMRLVLGSFLLFTLLSTPSFGFEIDSYEEESDAVKGLQREIEDGWDMDTIGSDVQHAIFRGWWELSMALIEAAKTGGVDVTNKVYQAQSMLRKKMTGLTDALQKKRLSSRISPAFEWAQSPDSVFLNVKFAHKLDTPATLGCQSENVTMSGRALVFRADCKEKNKKFELSLQLKEEIDPEGSTWSMASVGRAMITLKKAEEGVWPRLLLRPQKPSNMHVWWSMKEQHEGAIRDYEKALRRAESSSNKSNADAKDGKTDKADPSASTEPEAASTPTPTPSPADELRKKIMKEKSKEKKQREAEHKKVLAEITSRMRKEKGDIEAEAKQKKKEVEERIKEEKDAAEATLKEDLEKMEQEYAQRLDAELKELESRSEEL